MRVISVLFDFCLISLFWPVLLLYGIYVYFRR